MFAERHLGEAGKNRADEKKPQEAVVDDTRAVHLLGAERTPQNGSNKEGIGISGYVNLSS